MENNQALGKVLGDVPLIEWNYYTWEWASPRTLYIMGERSLETICPCVKHTTTESPATSESTHPIATAGSESRVVSPDALILVSDYRHISGSGEGCGWREWLTGWAGERFTKGLEVKEERNRKPRLAREGEQQKVTLSTEIAGVEDGDLCYWCFLVFSVQIIKTARPGQFRRRPERREARPENNRGGETAISKCRSLIPSVDLPASDWVNKRKADVRSEALQLVSPVPFNWPVSVRNVRSPVCLPTDKGAYVVKEPPTPDWKERPV
ncbi:hypothetical protein B0T13DRAFT_451836 [Neurospora crassa]|nr:hypothetical protein B0T13DRAFT_451836 [Neurospora crassa]